MRLRLLSTLCFALALPVLVSADDAAQLTISPPAVLRVGDHVPLVLTLALPEDALGFVMLTPSSQGNALDVVRGRLLRADARNPEAKPLVFDLPVVAREAGTAIVHVRAAFYRCREQKCVQAEVQASESVRVLSR